MAETDPQVVPETELEYGTVCYEDAKWEDARYLAEAIIQQLGNNHSIDGDPLWEAEWYSPELKKSFELSREVDEGLICYWITIRWDEGSYEESLGFDGDCTDLSFVEGEDAGALVYNWIDDAEMCGALEKDLKDYLRSAPIDFAQVPVSPLWHKLFGEIMRSHAAHDPIIKKYERSLHWPGITTLTKTDVTDFLAEYYALNHKDADLILASTNTGSAR